jgi:NADH-quinone oxidoreductase subunit A
MNSYLLTFILLFLLFGIIYLVSKYIIKKTQKPNLKKLSDLANDMKKIDVRFYLIVAMFVILTTSFIIIIPWVLVDASNLGNTVTIIVLSYLTLLVCGFVYAYKKGALDWD